MKTILIIFWLLLGIIAVWRSYWGGIKDWYELLHEDVRHTDSIKLKALLSLSIMCILGGLISLIILELTFKNVWYYKIPKKQ